MLVLVKLGGLLYLEWLMVSCLGQGRSYRSLQVFATELGIAFLVWKVMSIVLLLESLHSDTKLH